VREDLPTGTITFLFSDVEGSTALLHELGAEAYADVLAEHRRIVRAACTAEGGVEVENQGDAFFFGFPSAPAALTAAQTVTGALAAGRIHVRIGVHTGTALVTDEGYVGDDVHLAARVGASGHGGQIVLSQATRDLVDGLPLTDLGEHRLKDIPGAVSIFQLGSERFPPLKTISNTNLPHPASSFIGRERELEEVLTRISPGARLLTLTGPGGSGKTRLALEAAATLIPDYKAGVFWVGLASLRDPALVTETISQTLGAKDGLAEHIGEREMLLLLDNLEQVIAAAPELSALVERCPNLTLLATSRERLRVQGEVEYEVPPLASPEAVALFCERARLEPSGDIAELCAHLDNLPLAVELAAARTKALSPAQVLERLTQRLDLLKGGRDADPRQQTLRATIAWSYDLLSEQEQRLCRSLAVLAGGCTLEAAEDVADADLDTLESLVEKSLLRFSAERYWMLETIREYAGERVDEAGETRELGLRHAAFFLALAEEAGTHLRTHEEAEWLGRIEVEHDNVRAALSCLESADAERFIRLAVDMWRFWLLRGHFAEGREWLRRALDLNPEPSLERWAALEAAASLLYFPEGHRGVRPLAEESLEVAWQIGDRMSIAWSLHLLGQVEDAEGNADAAIDLFQRSLTYQDHPQPGDTYHALGHVRLLQGDYEGALEWFKQSEARNREQGHEYEVAQDLIARAYALHGLGRDDEATSLLRQSLELLRPLEEVRVLTNCFDALAATAAADRSEIAASLAGAAEILREEGGLEIGSLSQKWNPITWETLRARLSERSLARSIERGRAMDLEAAVAFALASTD
jgi:predicted ATPase